MIIIRNIKLRPDYTESELVGSINKRLHNRKYKNYKIIKKSLDCRKQNDIHYNLTVGIIADNERKIIHNINDNNIMLTKEREYTFPHILNTELREYLGNAQEYRPVIVGSGPAGYHAAIKLAYAGFRPIVLERGGSVEARVQDVENYWDSGVLDPSSNVCFGEGGAGTFSDGKLSTGNKDKHGYIREVLSTFVKYGAKPSTLYMNKPHIGTDELRRIVYNMRCDIERLGGEVRFGHTLLDIENDFDTNIFGFDSELPLYKLTVTDGDKNYNILCRSVIIAIGHSARDTYEMLYKNDFDMEPKPFALGVRIEHSSEMINSSMYGEDYKALYGDSLPTADYKLVYHSKDGRNIFSFCMCPGGYVVSSSTEDEHIVINGMSYSGRAGQNSNAAIVVSISPSDYMASDGDVLSGLYYQRELEHRAFVAGNGAIPLQLYGDMKRSVSSEEIGGIEPCIKGRWSFADMRDCLPDYVISNLIEAIDYFGTRIEGFDRNDAVITAIESRTSSPVRIVRDKDNMMATNHYGIVPAGEGAGYAGGITSAAVDGIRAAEAVSEYLIDDLIDSYKTYETAKYL